MRYVLLFTDGTITIGANDQRSPYTVQARKGWRDAVTELAYRVKHSKEGRITNLEIQSHGYPARIVVDHNDDINHENVHIFGAMLRAIMAPGALIEIMACLVAAVQSRPSDGEETQYSPAAAKAYWDGLLKAPYSSVGGFHPMTDDERATSEKNVAAARKLNLGAAGNGLNFCLALARASGCVVRASSLVQAEEIGDVRDGVEADGLTPRWKATHSISRDYDRFGDWEGAVWDFLPNGDVKFLGANLKRHRVRFPQSELASNLREQGGQSAGVGQRPQRINRAPLPV
jgi:hypothetical protein